VSHVVTDGGGVIYLAGLFTSMNGGYDGISGLGAVDRATGAAYAWAPQPNAQVKALKMYLPGLVIAGGNFTAIGNSAQQYLAGLVVAGAQYATPNVTPSITPTWTASPTRTPTPAATKTSTPTVTP
jgi:hypothetical protein